MAAGGRTRVDRFDGRARGELVAHQRAVAAHHHQRRDDAPALHRPPHRNDKVLQDRQQDAFSAAVVARSTDPSFVESWWPSTIGRSHTRAMAVWARCSCSGLSGLK